MAKKKTTITDGSEFRDIEAYTHDDKTRMNNPKFAWLTVTKRRRP